MSLGPITSRRRPARAFEHPLVGASLRRSQRTAVPEMLVQKVVDPLSHTEEVRAGPHDQPAGVKPTGSRVRQHRAQNLGDTAADRRRVDRPHRTSREQLAGARLRFGQALPRHRSGRIAQPPDRHSRQRDLLQRDGHSDTGSATAIAASSERMLHRRQPAPGLNENVIAPGDAQGDLSGWSTLWVWLPRQLPTVMGSSRRVPACLGRSGNDALPRSRRLRFDVMRKKTRSPSSRSVGAHRPRALYRRRYPGHRTPR